MQTIHRNESSIIRERVRGLDELVIERLQAGEGAVLLDEIMEKYGQDILQLIPM